MILKAYTDGSFDKEKFVYGCGCVLLDENDNIIGEISFGGNDPLWISSWNHAGELCAAMKVAGIAYNSNDVEKLIIYHDYEGVANFVTGVWGKNEAKLKATSRAYRDVMRMVQKKVPIEFIWTKSHSGNKFNDLADSLAKRGVEEFNA